MAGDDLLAQYPQPDLDLFSEDFYELARVSAELDRYYGKADSDLDAYIKKFNSVLKDFNKKYAGIILKLAEKTDSLQLRVFLKEKNLKDFFANSASRIKGITAAGLEGFNEVSVSDSEKFAQVIDSIENSLYLSYSDSEAGTSNVAVFYNDKEKIAEIMADSKEFKNQNSATFRIIAFYALKDDIQRSIEVKEKLTEFSFYSLLSEIEKREWYEKFSPRFLE